MILTIFSSILHVSNNLTILYLSYLILKETHMLRPFHLALPTLNLSKTIDYYINTLGCKLGRSDTTWADFNFYGHQVVFHEYSSFTMPSIQNCVDSKQVHVPHFGIVLTIDDWELLKQKLLRVNHSFIIEPYTRFKGTNGEQSTMFFLDNNGYAVEIKALADDRLLFRPF